MAAAAAVLGAVAGAGAVVSGPWANQSSGTSSTALPEDPALERIQPIAATDPETGVHAAVKLAGRDWGTLVSFAVTEVDGPRNCRLVAVLADGETEVLSTWTVPERGYGEGTEPPKLDLMAATAVEKKDIQSLRVQDISDDGKATTLVTVRAT